MAIDDPRLRGYLANLTPSEWEERVRDHVPEALEGRGFLERYQGHTDLVTEVDPARTYAVRVCTAHPIYEHPRVRRFRDLLTHTTDPERSTVRARRADARVTRKLRRVRARNPRGPIAWSSWYARLERLAASTAQRSPAAAAVARSRCWRAPEAKRCSRTLLLVTRVESGRKGSLLGGSSPGATSFGVLRLTPG